MKVLLIDDEQSLLDVFTTTLHTGGFEVVTAATGAEGINKAKTDKPDLILLDQVMPDINGNQVLQILKQDPLTQNIPVAILSNFNQDTMVTDAINLGAVDYILKYQIEPQDLIMKINQLAKHKPDAQSAPAHVPQSNPAVTQDTQSQPQNAPMPPPMPTQAAPEAPSGSSNPNDGSMMPPPSDM